MDIFINVFRINPPADAPPDAAPPDANPVAGQEEVRGRFLEVLDLLEERQQLWMRLLIELHVGHIVRPLEEIEPFYNTDARKQFRFTFQEIHVLADRLDLPEYFETENRSKISKVGGLCLVLHRLSFPRRFADAVPLFRKSEGTLSALFRVVVDTIYEDWKHILLFDHVRLTSEYLMRLAEAVRNRGGMLERCWGFVDGTHIEICRPQQNQELFYSGYKKIHSVKYQSITTPDGMITHLSGPYRGQQHDASILTDSKIRDYLFQHARDIHGNLMNIYGDEGYASNGQVRSPYRRRLLTDEEMAFNASMKRPRLSVEWGFGHITNHWSFLDFAHNLRSGLSPVGQYYPIVALFSNLQICMGRNTSALSYYGIPPPSLEEYLTPRDRWDEERQVMNEPIAFNQPWNNNLAGHEVVEDGDENDEE